MDNRLMFSKASDEWTTSPATFDVLNEEFAFDIDCAATSENHKCDRWLGPGGAAPDALTVAWGQAGTMCWLNPPYSRVRAFIAKAANEVRLRRCVVVALVPTRTDTRWWHAHVWHGNAPRPGVEVRFLPGRLKFGESRNSAPFPSVVNVFRPPNLPET